MSRKNPDKSEFTGRLRVVLSLCEFGKFSFNVGSKDVRFGENRINLDLDAESRPGIVADARPCLLDMARAINCRITSWSAH